MDTFRKRIVFVLITVVLVAVLVIASIAILLQGPRESSVELVSKPNSQELTVNDLYDGEMTIPYYDIPTSQYKPDDFTERGGVITYEGDSYVGINVNDQMGEIDWKQVADSGVEFAMIRVGYREYKRGKVIADSMFQKNMEGAIEAGLPVGVYFFSKAVSATEAEEEASFVLEQIRGYSVTWPVGFYWTYGVKDDGTRNESDRTIRCNASQVTEVVFTFCKKIKSAGFSPIYYSDKSMGYETLDLSQLTGFDMWYAEYRAAPSFYYAFSVWQYTREGSVPGISGNVPVNLALKKYGR